MIFEVINESASPVPSSGGFFQPAAVLKYSQKTIKNTHHNVDFQRFKAKFAC
jgi:hypothetical protein